MYQAGSKQLHFVQEAVSRLSKCKVTSMVQASQVGGVYNECVERKRPTEEDNHCHPALWIAVAEGSYQLELDEIRFKDSFRQAAMIYLFI